MSTSETDSDPEPELATDTVASLTTFVHSFATQPSHDPTDKETVGWAVDTLATLDFRLVRKDDALHGIIQNCADRILALFDTVLKLEPTTDPSCFMSDVASLLKPSFLHLLFQYRRLFRIIAAKDFKPGSAPLAIVCWVDVILAKLCDVIAYIAVGLDWGHFDQSLPESLKAHREEDNLRAAIQLPDNWDMLPYMLLSERASAAAKRLSVRLMLGGYIFYPVLSAQVGVDNGIHQFLSTFSEFVRQSAARVGGLRSVSGDLRFLVQQERLMGAMVITLFVAADMTQNAIDDRDADHAVAFRPQTMSAVMQLLRFVLNEEGYPTQMNILSPLELLDIPSSVIIRWGIVPQWTWSIWLDYRSLYADTIMHVTTAYMQHCDTGSGALELTDFMSSDSSSQAAVINIMIDLIFRFISVLSAEGNSKQLSAGMTNVLHGSCRLMSQWMNQNSCGIQDSKECCKALMVLFGCLCQNKQHYVLNDLVIECLSLMRGQCTREAWKVVAEDHHFRFFEALDQSFMQIKTALFRNDLSKSSERHAAQLMQFLIIMISKRVKPWGMALFVEFVQAAWDRALEIPPDERELLRETLLTCLAAARISGIDLPISEVTIATDEAMWRLGTSSRDMNFFLASAFSLYITSAPASVEPLTYLEGLERLLDTALLICARQHSNEDEPLALIVLPTICDALAHVLEYKDDATGVYTCANIRMAALGNILRTLSSREDSGYYRMLRRRLPRWLIGEEGGGEMGVRERREYEVVFCRVDGVSHLLYVTVV